MEATRYIISYLASVVYNVPPNGKPWDYIKHRTRNNGFKHKERKIWLGLTLLSHPKSWSSLFEKQSFVCFTLLHVVSVFIQYAIEPLDEI